MKKLSIIECLGLSVVLMLLAGFLATIILENVSDIPAMILIVSILFVGFFVAKLLWSEHKGRRRAKRLREQMKDMMAGAAKFTADEVEEGRLRRERWEDRYRDEG